MGLMISNYLDTLLAPFSIFLTLGYHAYLWRIFMANPSLTTIGANTVKRRDWFLTMKEGDDKLGMLVVQSLRNTLMATTLTASVAILITLALAALTTAAFDARRVFHGPFFGMQSDKTLALKYGSASFFLLASFLCSSIALGLLIDANFLINSVPPQEGESELSSARRLMRRHTRAIFERGFVLALVGNRALCVAFPLLLWILGAVPAAFASVALVLGLYELDFGGNMVGTKFKENL